MTRAGPFDVKYDGAASLPFVATDDYAVTGGEARIDLALAEVDRRYGRRMEPEARPAIVDTASSAPTSTSADELRVCSQQRR